MSINIENFKRIRQIILDNMEKGREQQSKEGFEFDYDKWLYDATGTHKTVEGAVAHLCGMTGCLGGWGSMMRAMDEGRGDIPVPSTKDLMDLGIEQKWKDYLELLTSEYASVFYGITPSEAGYLFYGDWHPQATKAPDEDVLTKLDRIIETGMVIDRDFDEIFESED